MAPVALVEGEGGASVVLVAVARAGLVRFRAMEASMRRRLSSVATFFSLDFWGESQSVGLEMLVGW